MKLSGMEIWLCDATPTKPYCIAETTGDKDAGWSVTFWLDSEGRVSGALRHEYNERGDIVQGSVEGIGVIPAEYVAFEENCRI